MARVGTRVLGDHGKPPMSDKDGPRNPFGRGERTIIRPNPGGRLPPTPAPAPPDPSRSPQTSRAPPATESSSAAQPSAAGRPTSAPPSAYAPAPTTPAAEEWIE